MGMSYFEDMWLNSAALDDMNASKQPVVEPEISQADQYSDDSIIALSGIKHLFQNVAIAVRGGDR
jgi:hypothetical protein